MRAENLRLLEFIGSSKRTFYIPVYQRNYDWKKDNCFTLFKDIEDVYKDTHRDSHFLGTIVYVESGSTSTFRRFMIIDGQQRLTTVMLLLKAIYDTSTDEDLKTDILESYLINKRCKEELRIKLKPTKSDSGNYKKLIDGQTDYAGSTQIVSNYRFLKNLVENSEFSPQEIFDGVAKLEIVTIELNREHENPQLVFESLNSTGLDLKESDLIRNFLLMGLDSERQEKLYDFYWKKLEDMLPDAIISEYVRDYLTLKTGSIPNKADVYKAFKKYYFSREDQNVEPLMKELLTYGQYYKWFKFCDCPDEDVNDRLFLLDKLKSTVTYPFILDIFEDYYKDNKITRADLCQALDMVVSYVIRRQLCELPSNTLNKVFCSLANDIEAYPGQPLPKKIALALAAKSGSAAFPSDALLREKLLTRDFYNFYNAKFVLEQIERTKSTETVGVTSEITIEHIMPRTLSEQWKQDLGDRVLEIYERYVNCLGNLTLTGYNSSLSNMCFEDKKTVYGKSNICITKDLVKYDAWGEAEIVQRSHSLIDDIANIWKCPEEITAKGISLDTRTEFSFADDIDATGRKPKAVEILGDEVTVTTWKELAMTVCQKLYEYDTQFFLSIINHRDFQPKKSKTKIFGLTGKGMRSPVEIAEGLYLETNKNANALLNICKLLVEKFDEMDEVCSYKLLPKT